MDYKQVEKRMNDEIDRLSNLPDDLIHRILSFLGIKCAIKLSALSSRWRYIWTLMPYLDFSVKNFAGSTSLSKFVTNFLSRRNNLVEVVSIKLHCYRDFSPGSLRQIMIYASSHNIQQLDIVYFLSDSIKFPLPLIRSESLKHLSFKKEPESRYSNNCKRSVLALTSTLELPALATLYLHDTTLCCDGNEDINSDTNIGLFSKCANLKTLTLKSCKVTGLNRLNICHPLLSNLTVEDVQGSFNDVNVVAPQLKNLTIDNGLKKYQYLISAPGLVSLLYKGHHCLDLSTDGIHLLEKADLCVTGNASALKIVCLFQHLQSVKFLTLNLEIVEILSSHVKLISSQVSPFANLKCLHIYPVKKPSEVQNAVKMSTKVEDYLLDNSPNATFRMVSREVSTS
ncbi:F-box domain, Leucine-rich repeat domain, L domain-like protein [Artemisia annua]|uniref:F-box domain, Leucine-rich repeat domain, L domain-like protein n=1 Tax=Artemisia annua TaxID=35608 RepID=A0A2U1L1D8_ARTAN|nr:F-box domain, Leucine-rich repeat domain, L domain-like protein [Artemisia annua]